MSSGQTRGWTLFRGKKIQGARFWFYQKPKSSSTTNMGPLRGQRRGYGLRWRLRSGTRQRNTGALELPVGTDDHVLPVAVRLQFELRGKCGSADVDVELAITGTAFEGAANIAAGLAPVSRQNAVASEH